MINRLFAFALLLPFLTVFSYAQNKQNNPNIETPKPSVADQLTAESSFATPAPPLPSRNIGLGVAPITVNFSDLAGEPPARKVQEVNWTTGNRQVDGLIRANAVRFGVDAYLIYCVMTQESAFNPRAVSLKGARGLMQLMPATAARFGVRNPHDPAQSIRAGAQYLRQLLDRFGGRVDLALAAYNAGEGNVYKYGMSVPPFRETQNYVRLIGGQYNRATHRVEIH